MVKIEPKENGPLFVEMHFYIKASLRRSFSCLCFAFFYFRGASHSLEADFLDTFYSIPVTILHLPPLKFPLCRRMLARIKPRAVATFVLVVRRSDPLGEMSSLVILKTRVVLKKPTQKKQKKPPKKTHYKWVFLVFLHF